MRVSALLALLLIPSCASVVHEDVDEVIEANDDAEEFGMRSYWFGMILRGPLYDQDRSEQEATDLQSAHRARIGELANEGKIILAGPFGPQPESDDPYIGLFLYTVNTREEAEALAASDPAVQAGRLRVKVVEWYGAAGITYPGNPVPNAAAISQ